MKYDFFVAGRWRNKEKIEGIVTSLRSAGFKVFCFLENDYSEAMEKLGLDENAMRSSGTETLPLEHPFIKEIFERDLGGQEESKNFLLVLPAGLAAHMEAGISFGKGQKCYAIGNPEKTETLYRIFDEIFPDIDSMLQFFGEKD